MYHTNVLDLIGNTPLISLEQTTGLQLYAKAEFLNPGGSIKDRIALNMIEEAEKRDHRKIGKALDLFYFDPTAPGCPYWLPKGLKMYNLLLDYWRREHEKAGYQEFAGPLMNSRSFSVSLPVR